MKKIAATVLAILANAAAGYAQSVIGPNGPSVSAPTKGTTENLSVTNGSRTSLSVGNSSSFGASANLSTSAGLTAIGRSALVPAAVNIESSIGKTGTSLGVTKINISNLTAKGGGTINPSANGGVGSGSTINSSDGQFASGDATVDGMNGSVIMSIGKTVDHLGKTLVDPNSEASFFAIVHPNCSGTTACAPGIGKEVSFEKAGGLVSGNAGASANVSTQTNIDIQANSFTQTFGQSF